ncbi:hypothetical protein Tco_1382472, partial [Tanacetum coccineum]
AIHKNVDNVLHDVIPKIASNATNDIIEDNLPKVLVEAKNVITVHTTTSSSTATLSSTDLQHQLYLKMKRSLQDQADDPELWEVLKLSNVDKVIPEDNSPKLIEEFQNVDKHVPTVYDHERIKATLRDMIKKSYILSLHKIHVVPFPEDDLEEKMNCWVQKEFKTFNEEVRLSIQHWKDSWHKRLYKINHRRVRANPEEYFSNHRIFEVVRVTTKKQHGLEFLEQIIVMIENNKPDSFSEADFKYLNRNDIEDLYYLCRNQKVYYRENKLLNSLMTFIKSCVI